MGTSTSKGFEDASYSRNGDMSLSIVNSISTRSGQEALACCRIHSIHSVHSRWTAWHHLTGTARAQAWVLVQVKDSRTLRTVVMET